MIIQYGYTDGTGEYYLIIDTDKCTGCGKCVAACPKNIFEMMVDDYDETKVQVRREVTKTLGFICPGNRKTDTGCQGACREVCEVGAISHSW